MRGAQFVVLIAVGAGSVSGCGSDADTTTPVLDQMFEIANQPELLKQQQAEQETLIQACMKAVGFEYLPVPDLGPPSVRALEDLLQLSVDQAVERGYGRDIDVGALPTDPNEAIVAELTEAQQLVYYAALYGDSSAGCSQTATEEMTRLHPESTFDAEEMEQVETEVSEVMAWLKASDAPAMQSWTACMASAGYQFQTPVDAREFVSGDDDGDVLSRIRSFPAR